MLACLLAYWLAGFLECILADWGSLDSLVHLGYLVHLATLFTSSLGSLGHLVHLGHLCQVIHLALDSLLVMESGEGGNTFVDEIYVPRFTLKYL